MTQITHGTVASFRTWPDWHGTRPLPALRRGAYHKTAQKKKSVDFDRAFQRSKARGGGSPVAPCRKNKGGTGSTVGQPAPY